MNYCTYITEDIRRGEQETIRTKRNPFVQIHKIK